MGILRRRRILRTAVVGGAAYHMGKSAGNNQAEEQQEQEKGGQSSKSLNESQMQELEKLGKLHENGTLTDEEFTSAKRKILDSI